VSSGALICGPARLSEISRRRKEIPYRSDQMVTSKISSKAQTTLPRSVRTALRLGPGDVVAYHVEGDRAILTKSGPSFVVEDPFATFSEWASEADRKGYANL